MAVPSLILGLTRRRIAWIGLSIAVLAESTTLVLVWPVLGVLLPIARIATLIWPVAAGAVLPLEHNGLRLR